MAAKNRQTTKKPAARKLVIKKTRPIPQKQKSPPASLPKSPPASFAILVTGVPGTGKTTLVKAWCEKEDWAYLGLNELVEEKKLYSGIDEEDMAKVARLPDLEKAANAWLNRQERPAVVESHLGCEIRLNVARVLVLRLHPDELARRLEARGYSPSKVRENKMAELLDYCTVRAIQIYGEKHVFEQDASRQTPEENRAVFSQFAASQTVPDSFKPHVNWGNELFKEVDVYRSIEPEGHVHKT